MGILKQDTFDLLEHELDELNKKVIVESKGDDILTIQMIGQIKQVFHDMGKEIIKVVEQYGDKE